MPPLTTSQWAEVRSRQRRNGLRAARFPQFFAVHVEDDSGPKKRVETWLSRPGPQVAIYLFLMLVLVGSIAPTLWLVSRTSPLVPKFDDWVAPELPSAISPAQLGVGPDPRYLGVFVHSLHISPS